MGTNSTPQGHADFSAVDSREKAESLIERGELTALPMLPAMFGGDENDIRNIVFVPPAIARRKEEIDREVILPRLEAGARVEYQVTPENVPLSFVPIALVIAATVPHPLHYRLAIWNPR